MFNKVILIGQLGADPDISATEKGLAISFPLATQTRCQDEDKEGGEKKSERIEWHRVVARGKLAKISKHLLGKGKLVLVEGAIKTSTWNVQTEDGKKELTYRNEIIASEIKQISPSFINNLI